MKSFINLENNKPGNTAIEKLKLALQNIEGSLNTAEFINLILQLEHEHLELLQKIHELNERTKELSLFYRIFNLMGNLPGMAYRCKHDKNRTMEFVSSGCIELTGYIPESITGNAEITFAEIIHPDDRQGIWDFIHKTTLNNEPFVLEYRIRTLQGEERWVWEKGRVINYGEDGKNSYLEGIVLDITDRKKTETELQKLKNDLEMQVVEKTKELHERISELERFHEATIEREFRIKELRNELQLLKKVNHDFDETGK
jgi:PAS domain S-box-containing protein